MDRLHYLDFDIRIAPEGAKYRTGILHSTADEASSITMQRPSSGFVKPPLRVTSMHSRGLGWPEKRKEGSKG